ncbi:MAG TPA: hypothetical protein VHX63_10515 [Acidobacteriaceae bacterium]|nr:hypothetical protein [Acidobacteriaceae bacterium]
MSRIKSTVVACLILVLGSVFAASRQALAQDAKTQYSRMAPLNQYLMADRNAEIALARSAAPKSISRDAEVLVLGRHGYETAVKGKNGFVCIVERSWMAPFDDPEFLNPDQRLPLCLNPPAARTHLPLTLKMTDLALAGLSRTQMFDRIKAAFNKKELPLPEPGSMCYMMSKQQYFGRKYGHADSHLMFWFPKTDDMLWGAGLPGSPVYVHQYSPEPITEFIISVSKWSDGTAAPTD